jgi:hypothetical protein
LQSLSKHTDKESGMGLCPIAYRKKRAAAYEQPF